MKATVKSAGSQCRASGMIDRILLLGGRLHYGPDIVLHTGSSGAVPYLDELHLVLEQDGEQRAVGGIRRNIEYLTGIPGSEIERQVIEWASAADWSRSFEDLLADLHRDGVLCGPSRALIDQTLHDGVARSRGIPICALWGKSVTGGMETNQTLFWCDEDALIRRAAAYVERGFKSLKLRMGVRSFEEDLERLRLLRERFGTEILLAADVNGQWPDAVVFERIHAVTAFDLDYLEQPASQSSWPVYEELAAKSPIRVMLDESASSPADIDRIIKIGGRLAAHLKLVKMGGFRPLIAAGRRLIDAGVPVMIGQMNEGALATAAAAHAAIILGTTGNELYGADGIVDDPAETPRYVNGRIHLTGAPGIGPIYDESMFQTRWTRLIGASEITRDPSPDFTLTGR